MSRSKGIVVALASHIARCRPLAIGCLALLGAAAPAPAATPFTQPAPRVADVDVKCVSAGALRHRVRVSLLVEFGEVDPSAAARFEKHRHVGSAVVRFRSRGRKRDVVRVAFNGLLAKQRPGEVVAHRFSDVLPSGASRRVLRAAGRGRTCGRRKRARRLRMRVEMRQVLSRLRSGRAASEREVLAGVAAVDAAAEGSGSTSDALDASDWGGLSKTTTLTPSASDPSVASPSVAVADFDGDSNFDIAAPVGFALFGVWRGNGDGTFQGVWEPSIPSGSLSTQGPIQAALLNADTDADLLVLDRSWILKSFHGTPTATSGWEMTTAAAQAHSADDLMRPYGVVQAKLDSNGSPDFVFGWTNPDNSTSDITGVTGSPDGDPNGFGGSSPTGRFGATCGSDAPMGMFATVEELDEELNAPTFPLAVGDFNRDGLSDLACPNNGSPESSIGVLASADGSGGWNQIDEPVLCTNATQPAKPFATFESGTVTSQATGDFNGDGNLDLAATVKHQSAPGSRGRLYVLYGFPFGPGVWYRTSDIYTLDVWHPRGLTAADFDGDGLTDLAYVTENNEIVVRIARKATAGMGFCAGIRHARRAQASQSDAWSGPRFYDEQAFGTSTYPQETSTGAFDSTGLADATTLDAVVFTSQGVDVFEGD